MNPNEQNPDQLQQLPVTDPAPTPASPQPNPVSAPQAPMPSYGPQPGYADLSPRPTSNYVKRVKVIGTIMIVLGIIAMVSQLLDQGGPGWMFSLIMSLFQVVVGVGLLMFRKLAYIIFNVIAFLAVLGGLLYFASLALTGFMPLLFIGGFVFGLILLLLQLAQVVFYATALVLLHPKPVRELFHW